MKTKILSLIVVLIISLGAKSFAQDRSYKDGTVWTMSFIKVNPGQDETYLNSLKTSWKAVHDEGIKQGLIVSYKILAGNAASPDDWNLVLMVEYKKLASMEGNDDKWDAIQATILPPEDMKKLMESRVAVRTIYGDKLLREVVYK